MDKDSDVESNHKLFVGNVPFKCTNEEFNNIFENEPGFVKAELVYRNKSKLTRGFGFVEFNTEEDLNNTLFKKFSLMDRELRTTKYELDKNVKTYKPSHKLFVRNLGDLTESDLFDCFSRFGNVTKCYLLLDKNTNESRGLGVVEYEDETTFKDVLEKNDIDYNELVLNVFKYKNNSYKKNNKFKFKTTLDNKSVYRHGYNDGLLMGRNEGYKSGYTKGYNDKSDNKPFTLTQTDKFDLLSVSHD